MTKKLNKRQLTYCYWRARDFSQEESRLKAGYKAKGTAARSLGSRLEKNVNVIVQIEKEKVNIFDRQMITEEYVLEGLRKIAENGQQEANKVAAFQLLGKYLAMFTDKLKNEGLPQSQIIIIKSPQFQDNATTENGIRVDTKTIENI